MLTFWNENKLSFCIQMCLLSPASEDVCVLARYLVSGVESENLLFLESEGTLVLKSNDIPAQD